MRRRVQILVMAKSPLAGAVKTRLCPPYTLDEAARLAAAALDDTLAAVAATVSSRRTLVLSGPTVPRPAGIGVVAQRGDGLGERLSNAYADTACRELASLLVGMDTPQITPRLLEQVIGTLFSRGTDAVLGPADDGGWWCLALRDPYTAQVLADVPMSTPQTFAETMSALRSGGLRVRLAPPLTDVDTADDVTAVALAAPRTRFAHEVAELSVGHAASAREVSAARLYSLGFRAVGAGQDHGLRVREATGRALPLALQSWYGQQLPGDDGLVRRCSGPTLDVGCGPGRLAASVGGRGIPVLGVDPVPAAVLSTRSRGAAAIRRSVFDRVPGEGRWQHVLLADGNVGIGG